LRRKPFVTDESQESVTDISQGKNSRTFNLLFCVFVFVKKERKFLSESFQLVRKIICCTLFQLDDDVLIKIHFQIGVNATLRFGRFIFSVKLFYPETSKKFFSSSSGDDKNMSRLINAN